MADDPTPSAGGSVTPTPTTPVTGTPAQPGVIPATTPALSHEDAMKRLADLERSLNNAKEENDRHSKRLSTYEKQEKERIAAEQAAKDAQLSEIDRITKQHAEAEAKIKQFQQQLVLEKVINAAQKKNIIDPELAAMAVEKSLEFGDDGMPTNLDKALEELIKNKPYLVQKAADPVQQQQPTPAQSAQTPHAPAIPAMNPGRAQIAQPGGNTQQVRPTRLSDLNWKQ